MDTLLLIIGVNLAVFGATAFTQARRGLKPFARGAPIAPERRGLVLTAAAVAVVAGVVLLAISYTRIVGI
jgi:lysylphosphatidylglycerol synthetase-like protein (DUF2156 family)